MDKFRERFEVVRGDILACQLRHEPVAGTGPSGDLGLLGFPYRGCPGKPAAQPVGSDHRR